MANYREPQWLLPNEKNLAMPASDATVGSGLAEDRHSLYSMDFDGSNDYIDCGDNDLLSFGNGSSDFPFTISAWVYIEGSSTFPVFDKYPDSGSWSLREYRMLEVNSSNQVFCTLYDSSENARFDIYSDSTITRNQWQHLSITYDGRGNSSASDGVKIYINGVESTKTVNPFGTYVAMENKSTPVRIGRIISTYADGKIDEVALFRKELSASEVSALSTANAPANILALSDKPVAYWPLGEQARRGSEWQFPNEVLQSQVFDFDGSTDFIDCGIPSFLNSTSVFTSSLWFNTNDVGTQTTLWANGSSASQLWVISKFEDDLIIYGGTSTKYYRKNNLFSINTWYNLIVVYDGSQANADRFKAYLNGDLLTGATINGTIETITPTFTTNLNIGRIGYAAASYFNGKMSNVAF
jgi:hypothetical protein